MAVRYTITCDGCGRIIATSTSSARAARAEAQLNRGANHGPDGDHCGDCRKKMIHEQNEAAKGKAAARAHSISTQRR